MRKTFYRAIFLIFTFLFFTGCATNVEINVQRVPALDTANVRRIAVMPFESADGRPLYQNAARHITTAATGRIQATNHFVLVNPSAIVDARGRGEGIENYVDALFSGQITLISERTTANESQFRNRNGETVTTITYIREVEVEFNYFFTRSRDGTLIGPVAKKGNASDSNEVRNSLATVDSLVRSAIDSQLRNLHRDVAPYTVRITRSLERERNRELKPQMDAALAEVKARNYRAASQSYLAIWRSHQSVAAAVNASILYEAMGELQTAVDLMQNVFSATGSPLAGNALARLNRELSELAGLEQFAGAQSPAERVSNHAVSEVNKVLPTGARLWIHNNAETNRNMINDIIDNMISGFLSAGVVVVERQMIDVVLREQNFQMEGYVSDEDFVSIGHFAGANTVVLVSITGIGAGRRLQVRLLDIRTGSVIMQSGTGSEWNL